MSPVSFARAVEDSARTMLLVCGTMTMLRVFATLTDFLPDAMRLPLTTLLEVTTGAVTIANQRRVSAAARSSCRTARCTRKD